MSRKHWFVKSICTGSMQSQCRTATPTQPSYNIADGRNSQVTRSTYGHAVLAQDTAQVVVTAWEDRVD
ncbi:BZ3500_MvSof-1268-A1-R1_Chr12-2g03826 [Microbotryum saponariae]|uniref:BZ3500_MvSof-1268-A1-R1_Chr12-2g03826 protein n=1 Tax=Microbotryum saponariae TaxID=289078 RepID=A0A2X0LEF7_9BASI|nr:BZ3500_MvSof-1268-A1-R1_Chr12-2g03826 [Microbotryum saponariae]